MAICRTDLTLLIRLKEQGYIPDRASVIEIGAQQLSNSFLRARDEVNRIGQLFDAGPEFVLTEPLPTPRTESGAEGLCPDAPPARVFWLWLGLEYASIDIDGSPDSLPLDLNYDDVPRLDVGKYHLVTNFGTTEHVANQLNAFKVIHDLTSLGGVMLHSLPAQGMMNHGLVNYNMKFFWMLARSNGYQLLYADYVGTPDRYPISRDIIDNVKGYNESIIQNAEYWTVSDAALIVVLQKQFQIDFIPPIDVNTGSKPANETLASRYWTVYTPDAFTRLAAKAAGRRVS
jgi:hypothetical protein